MSKTGEITTYAQLNAAITRLLERSTLAGNSDLKALAKKHPSPRILRAS